jgi:tetratricopeptide (TPR) repeat protein
MLAEEDDDPRARSDAIDHFAAALRLRERLGDPARILLTLFNALGTQTKRYRADGSGAEELIRLADRARVLAHESPNPTTATAALSNAAQAMLAVGRQDATAVAREALDLARSLGSTDTYLQACASAASIHLRFDEYERAREFCEEGLELMDRFRDEGGGSRYLAQLEWRYRELQQMLDVALELTGAAAEERWWAVERGAGRIALDRMTGLV